VADFFLPTVEVRREKIFKPRAEFIAERFPDMRSGRVADIGAGFGLFLEEMGKKWPKSNLVAIEPSIDMAEICRKKGFTVLETTLENVALNERFYLMTAFELFEHLHDPLPFVEKVYNLLNPGGYLFLTTLNGLGFDIQILWEQAKSVFPPHHLNFFNPRSMEMLLTRNEFEIIEICTPGQLDWDIIESGYRHEGLDPGRFFKTVSRCGTEEAKRELQRWIRVNNFSSHMRIIAKKR
jgi:2-polyprenyl-3-methyl-5-hydroxy-6-metoxy-1,4-benzoquinol methylase